MTQVILPSRLHNMTRLFAPVDFLTRPQLLTHMAKASFTSVGNSADSPKPLLQLSPATGHVTEILDI
jgi:hypothetical protein